VFRNWGSAFHIREVHMVRVSRARSWRLFRKNLDRSPKANSRVEIEGLEGRCLLTAWYVAPYGADNANGSLNAPVATLNKASTLAQPGDTIFLRGNGGPFYWTTWQNVACVGTQQQPITIMPYNNEVVTIDGSNSLGTGNIQNDQYQPLVVLSGQHITFKNVYMRNSIGRGLNMNGSYLTADNITIHDNYAEGITADAYTYPHDLMINNCTIYRTCLAHEPGNPNYITGWGSAININQVTNLTIQNSRVYHNYGEGIGPFNCTNVLIQDNIAYDNNSVNLYVNNNTNTIVQRNFVYNDSDGPQYHEGDLSGAFGIVLANENGQATGVNNVQVLNNVVVNTGIAFEYGDWLGGGGMRNCLIMNNTFYGGVAGPVLGIYDANGGHYNTRFANNIFRQTTGNILVDDHGNGSPGSITFDHNSWTGGSINNSRETGTGDVNVDPAFVNPGILDPGGFRLTSGSQMINRGSSTSAPSVDFTSATRDSVKDIGAFEYGTVIAASGTTTMQAENFNFGGEGVGYHDIDASNNGGVYRPNEGVDLARTTDVSGGYVVGWAGAAEWMRYTVNVATAGLYNVTFRIAGWGGSLHLENQSGTNLTGVVNLPSTGGFDNWTNVTINNVSLAAGSQTLRLVIDAAGFNLNHVAFTRAASNGTPYGGTALAIASSGTTTMQAENYNLGGEGVAYHDFDGGNNGGAYRPSEGVDLEGTADAGGGYNVGWTSPTEYMKYTVNVATAGTYRVTFRIAGFGGSLHLENQSGTNLTGTVNLANTGGYQNWTNVTVNNISLAAGVQTLRLVTDAAGFNLNYLTFTRTA
jgi:hypothetical protein